ncbi:hypothetical protein VP01_1347g2 [Puccinia sorghi]|uniref:2-(3-amino-3-carboxypropyl)histidine synthase subunit 1 n=1 Tax=Puccinia sorghi TaxID=27349 RepID=A0A0L6VNZ4_9BASI|nr:hypothetical protein VP01_1347g2 [Puccinia sorghi]
MSNRFVGKTGKPTKKAATTTSRTNQIPLELLNNNQLNSLISQSLPQNYNFELHKTIHQVNQNNVAILGLQMPEGLLQFSLIISDIINKFCPNCHQIIVLGDVTYGACCVDDYTAKALGCQMLIHYGHSCLIPVDQTSIKTLYVFVEIGIDRQHLADTIKANFPACMHQEQEEEKNRTIKHVSISHEEEQELHLALVGTVQFVSAVQALKHELEQPSSQSNQPKMITPSAPDTIQHHHHHHQPCRFKVTVPQVKPLSPGEILGCTAPKLSPEIDAILYLGDGRFHLESIMIANPTIPAFRYDPYEKKITHEGYDHAQMRAVRANAIEIARESLRAEREDSERGWAVVLGTLGRQGSLNVLKVEPPSILSSQG